MKTEIRKRIKKEIFLSEEKNKNNEERGFNERKENKKH